MPYQMTESFVQYEFSMVESYLGTSLLKRGTHFYIWQFMVQINKNDPWWALGGLGFLKTYEQCLNVLMHSFTVFRGACIKKGLLQQVQVGCKLFNYLCFMTQQTYCYWKYLTQTHILFRDWQVSNLPRVCSKNMIYFCRNHPSIGSVASGL